MAEGMAAVRLPPNIVVTFFSDLGSEMSKPERSASRTLRLGLAVGSGVVDFESGLGCCWARLEEFTSRVSAQTNRKFFMDEPRCEWVCANRDSWMVECPRGETPRPRF